MECTHRVKYLLNGASETHVPLSPSFLASSAAALPSCSTAVRSMLARSMKMPWTSGLVNLVERNVGVRVVGAPRMA